MEPAPKAIEYLRRRDVDSESEGAYKAINAYKNAEASLVCVDDLRDLEKQAWKVAREITTTYRVRGATAENAMRRNFLSYHAEKIDRLRWLASQLAMSAEGWLSLAQSGRTGKQGDHARVGERAMIKYLVQYFPRKRRKEKKRTVAKEVTPVAHETEHSALNDSDLAGVAAALLNVHGIEGCEDFEAKTRAMRQTKRRYFAEWHEELRERLKMQVDPDLYFAQQMKSAEVAIARRSRQRRKNTKRSTKK